MVKTILYTSNPDFVPNNLEQVFNFAHETGKFYVCYAAEGSKVSTLEVGAHVVTAKGNNVYVLEVTEDNVEHPFAKKSNITNFVSVDYPFASKKSDCKKASVSNMSNRIKEMFMPVEAENVRIATDGTICVATTQGYVSIDKDNNLISYPEEMTLDLPVFIISKPKEQLQVGDVIVTGKSYAKVIKINGNRINAIGYTGNGKVINTIKDFLFNQTMVRVVVSLAGNIGGQINPMLLMALSKGKNKSLLPLLMMNQQGGALNVNPMMLMMLNEDIDAKDLLMMSAFSGNNLFNK